MTDENRRSKPDASSDAALDEALRRLHHEMRADPPRLDDVRTRVLAAARAESKGRPRRVPVKAGVPRSPFRRWGPMVAAAASVAAAVVVPLSMLPDDTGAVGPAGQSSERTATTSELAAQDVLLRAAKAAEAGPARTVIFPVRIDQNEFVSHVVDDHRGAGVLGQARMREIRSDDGRVWKTRRGITRAPEWVGHGPGYTPEFDSMHSVGVFCASARARGWEECVDEEGWYRPESYRDLVGEERPLHRLNSAFPRSEETPWRVGESDGADDTFDTAIRALSTGVVPAEVRAAMYRELAAMPGVHVTAGNVTMSQLNNILMEYDTGVTGVAVGIDDSDTGQRREIVVDPDTGEFVAARVVALDGNDLPGVQAGAVLWSLSVRPNH